LLITNATWSFEDNYWTELVVSGLAKNIGSVALVNVKIYFKAYNASDQLISSDYDYINPWDRRTLNAGQESFWKITDSDCPYEPSKVTICYSYDVTVVAFPDLTASEINGVTFDIAGTWVYSTSQPTVTGVCPAGSPITETCTITQSGESFTLNSSAGTYYGTISGAEYSGATPETVVDEEGGTIINTISFTAESTDIALGAATSLYTHPSGVTCLWEYTFSLVR
jgi:hypothetical protein